jgi:hypothetical protein
MSSPPDEKHGQTPSTAAVPQLPLVWEQLVPHVLHPLKVTVIEALRWVGQPLSATDLAAIFDEKRDHYLSLVSYHVKQLAEYGALVSVRTERKRGAVETFYYFPAQTLETPPSKRRSHHQADSSRPLPSKASADEASACQT